MGPQDQLAILNDPTFVPFITHDGQCLMTHDPEGRFLIVSSTLRIRFSDATHEGRGHETWMRRKGRMYEDEYHR